MSLDEGKMINLFDLERGQLQALLADWGEPSFRADQLWSWIYQHYATDPEQMTNLPASLRRRLADSSTLDALTPLTTTESSDEQTQKTLFQLPDGQQVETVLMHYTKRQTVCVSTQVGCPVNCPFCATGQSGFVRDLTPGEIVAQVLFFARQLAARNLRVTNVVFMGMGEPMLNYAATWAAVRRLNDKAGFGLGARAMTISTAGWVPGIRQMSTEPEQVGLAVSLHAPNDWLRDQLVPLNRRYPLRELMDACAEYVNRTNRRMTFEYALMDGINDWPELAHELATLIGSLFPPAKVNLIPLNPTAEDAYRPSSAENVRAFQNALETRGVDVTVRLRRGLDIQAGCGQLRSKYNT